MVEGTSLENWQRRKAFVGSNPTLSASRASLNAGHPIELEAFFRISNPEHSAIRTRSAVPRAPSFSMSWPR